MPDLLQVITLVGNRPEADRIAIQLVEARLAACVQVLGPVASTFRWQGRLEHSDEWMCLIKTSSTRYSEVEQLIRRLHGYEVPEIIATPIVAGSADYLAWLRQEMISPPPSPDAAP